MSEAKAWGEPKATLRVGTGLPRIHVPTNLPLPQQAKICGGNIPFNFLMGTSAADF